MESSPVILLGYVDIALHGLSDIFAVGIIFSVKNTDTVYTDDITPLEIVHGDAFVYNGLFFIQ